MTSPTNKFDSGTRAGITLSVVASMLSAISVSIVLSSIVIRRVKSRARRTTTKHQAHVNLPPLDATDSIGFVNLMISELLQAISGLLSIKWVSQDFITESELCTAQGRIKQIGDIGVALFSLVIAVDTFLMLCFGWRPQKRIRSWAIIGIGLFSIMLVAVGSGVHSGSNPPYYGNTRFWCWIRPEYKTDRIVLQYLWMWIALFVIIILYGIMALINSGKLRLGNGDNRQPMGSGSSTENIIAKTMLPYPAVYVVCVLPLTIVRWVDLNDDNISAAAIIVTSIIYSLSGFFNVLLFKFTRPTLIQDDIDNIDGSSQHELPTSASGYSGVPTGAGGTTYKPTGLARPVVASPGPEASAAKYARTHAGSQATSSHDQEHRHH